MTTKNQIKKFLKEKFGTNVSFVEERFWSETQSGSDTGYHGSDIEDGIDGNKYIKNSNIQLFLNYVFEFEQEDGSWKERGFANLDEAECFVENLD